MVEIRYICEGSCGTMVSEAEFKSGKNRCGSRRCERDGLLLVRKGYCPRCKGIFKEFAKHDCR